MIPWIVAMAGLQAVKCPHCGHKQTHSRRLQTLACASCRRSFGAKEGRDALHRGKRPRPL